MKTSGGTPPGGNPLLYFDMEIDSIPVGEDINIPLKYGTASEPIDSVYALIFTVDYNKNLVDSASVKMNFNNSWLGTVNTDMIALQKKSHSFGKLRVGITRIDQLNANGQGPIAYFGGITIDNLSGKNNGLTEPFTLGVSDVSIITKSNMELLYSTIQDTALVWDSAATFVPQLNRNAANILLFPNPANTELTLKSSESIAAIRVINTLGQEVLISEPILPDSQVARLNVSNWQAGWYVVMVTTESGNSVHPISILH